MKVEFALFQMFSGVLDGFSGILCDDRACQKRFGSTVVLLKVGVVLLKVFFRKTS